MKRFLVASMAFLASTVAVAQTSERASFVDSHVRFATPATHASTTALSDALQSGHFAQQIDHKAKAPGETFTQRYWYDSEFASGPDAPVLYHVCGESNVDGAYFLTDNVLAWAKALGAHVVWLEHRYYGESQPFTDLSTEHLQYLTLNNALEDLATFQMWMAQEQGWAGKWIAIGGSYSATLSALYRQKHPELVVGALAASAPMISGIGSSVGTQDDVDSMSSTDISPDGSDRQWSYQSCTELGYWLAEGDDRSAGLDLPRSWLCQQLFADTSYYDTGAYNLAYDTPFISSLATAPSNILFTEGTDDVWTNIGLATQTNLNPSVTVLTIDGGGHHFDLNAATDSDSQAVIDARAKFVTLATQWLAGPKH